jgi:hypothetical protein
MKAMKAMKAFDELTPRSLSLDRLPGLTRS